MKMVIELPETADVHAARSPAPCGTPSAIPSRRSSASSMCIRTAWFRWASSCLRGWAIRRARRTAICSTTSSIPASVALSEGRHAALVGRQVAAGIGQARRAVPDGRRLSRASAKAPAAPICSPARAWTKPGPPASQLAEAVMELLRAGKPFTQENLAATYVARRRASWVETRAREAEECAQRLPSRHRARPDRHGAGGLTRRHALTSNAQTSAGARSRFARAQSAMRGDRTQTCGRSWSRVERWTSAARCAADGARLAGDSVRWPAAGDAAGRAADGRQSAGHARLRRSRRLPRPATLRRLRREDLHRHVLRPGHHAGRERRCRYSNARSACTAARCLWNCAHDHTESSFTPARAGCTRRRTDTSRIDDDYKLAVRKLHGNYALHIVVCAGIVPDPLQTLEPITGPNGPGLKNEMVLPAVLDPWAASALYEAAHLAAKNPGQQGVAGLLGPKAKLQQVMMTVAQKVAFELVPVDGPIGGFADAHATAAALADAIAAIPGLDRERLLLFGGWESATRGAGVTLQLVGERLGITDQFQGVDQIDAARRWIVRSAGARRRRQAPGFGVRGSAGGAGMGHGQSRRAAQQSADRHGEHAHHDARAAEGQGRGARRRTGCAMRQ